MLTFVLSRLRYQWLLVVLMLLVVEASPASAAESQGTASGRSNYDAKCASCHGASGKGNGLRTKLTFWLKLPDFSDSVYMQTRSDDALFQSIKAGGKSGMPAFGLELPERDIKDLVIYIRGFTKAPGPPKPAGAAR